MRLLLGGFAAGSLFAFALASSAQNTNAPRILFLHLKLKGQSVSLIDATSVPGVLKPARVAQGDIRFELVSQTGGALWQGALADPRGQIPDFPALDDSDKTPRHAPARPDEIEFTLRVPHLPAAQRIDFYTWENPPTGMTNAAVKKFLGRLLLPARPNAAR